MVTKYIQTTPHSSTGGVSVRFSINSQTSLSLSYMEMGAAIHLQGANECNAQHWSHRPNTCWFFFWRLVVRLPALALVNYIVRITKSYGPLSS